MIKFIGTAQKNKNSLLYYSQIEDGNEFLKFTISQDGFKFSDKSNYAFVFNGSQKEVQDYNWKNFRLTKQDQTYLFTYKEASKKDSKLYFALSNDLIRWQKIGPVSKIKETAVIIPEFKHKEQYVMYYGEKNIKLAYSEDLRSWKSEKKTLLAPRENYFDNNNLEVGNAYEIKNHILLTYYVKKEKDGKISFSVGIAYFDKNDPTKCIFRDNDPLWESPEYLYQEKIEPLGSVIINNELILYWLIGDTNIYAVSCKIPSKDEEKTFSHIIKKHKDNPIIAPNPNNPWESRATFNSAAIYEDGKVHFLYRALGDTDLSVLGYASSKDGLTIDERLDEPAYIPREPFETPGNNSFKSIAAHFASGGGYGGVEDPRITRVDDTIYLTYVAFDGATPPRAAMSSIDVEDFLKQKWDKWRKPILISAPNMINKSAVVFPKKINGKYVMLHRVYPNILVDFLEDLEFNEYLQGHYFIPPRRKFWDSKKVGAGAPPMETKDGWLLVYQSVGYQDPGRYKIGAMMLDKDNPSKVLYRTHVPIISPDEPYENEGFKAGVVYPCGAVIMNNKLNIYYGGADSVVCAASAELDLFLDKMKHHREPKLTKITGSLFN
jgi:beta-1,2-mannobiose phosphorylase / 1,2-beta-oligomannan phosphorylase